ncbi:hypothetical protein [Acinetobacter radioresistens]|uniref:hypothetical protein n=1 Tax=Acinetobacter radioresistens TaxID=40216 RepID=UPI0022458E55|nr:hypothetical protein [Acinetobacter radioresistens]MCX0334890.1 hypothetical protein [Acinetobacter radioresistens]
MKISKGFWGMLSVILVVGIAFYSYLAMASKPEILNGYKEGSEEYKGYTFARDNQLKSKKECLIAMTEFPELPKVSSRFMNGCETYFKKPSE